MTGHAWALMLIAVLALTPAAGANAQATETGLTTLVADTVRIDGEDRLVAEGNVEVFSRGTALRADRLTYDRRTERLTVSGDIRLRDADGTIVLADAGELDRDLENGIIEGVRVILDERLQIASARSVRREGRFLDSRRVTASSCQICEEGETPLWEIRAQRVIHDEENAQVFFYNARFRIAGVPVFYLPALRVPDGTEDRVRGFLQPNLFFTSDLGNGIEFPYFVPFGDHADATLYPLIGEGETRSLGARYRQAFVNGSIEANAAASQDSLEDGTRGYFFLDGRFGIPRGFNLTFGLETVSDDAYLTDYGISDADRLRNEIGILRVRDRQSIEADLTHFTSLRTGDADTDEPNLVADARWRNRLAPAGVGGWLDLDLIANAFQRASDANIDGRDRSQIRGTAAWRRTWTAPGGVRFGARGLLNADVKQISDDDRFDSFQAAITPEAAATLSWPLTRTTTDAVYLIEPVAQLAWTAPDTLDGANDDSTEVEFGTGNLFEQNRFPGLDRYEEGTRGNLAVRWSRTATGGLSLAVTGGRVYRLDNLDQFDADSGLAGRRSDWLAQVDADFRDVFNFRNLTVLDDDAEPTRSETRLTLRGGDATLSSSYIWQDGESREDLDGDVSEVAAQGTYVFDDTWFASAVIRHDFDLARTNYRELGIGYQNECIRVDLSAVQRFRRTPDTEPVTRYGITVTLAGLGSNDTLRRRACAN